MWSNSDSDDYYVGYDDDDWYSDDSPPASYIHVVPAATADRTDVLVGDDDQQTFEVPSLVDIASRFVALKFPFAYIEHRNPPVPEELQLKVISFSFPDNEEVVRKYAEFSSSIASFVHERALWKNGCVKNLTQIGFRLSATVEEKTHGNKPGKNYVTIYFDRGKITDVHCSGCSGKGWCKHVIATAFERVRSKQDSTKVSIHPPVSDSLNLLNREQLLKFAQYLLCQHKHEPVVDSAQELLDNLLGHRGRAEENDDGDINAVAGAPDPTAGPGMDENVHWFVAEEGFNSRFNNIVHHGVDNLGFGAIITASEETGYSVQELWDMNSSLTVSKDKIDHLLDSQGSRNRHASRQDQVLEVLKNAADLLKDENLTAVAAVRACTEKVVEKLKCHASSNRRHAHHLEGRERNGSRSVPDEGFMPRFFKGGCTISALSRLWRVAVLDPKMSSKNRQVILQGVSAWDQEVKEACQGGRLCVWRGLEISLRLGQLYQQNAEVAALMTRPCCAAPAVRSCVKVHFCTGDGVQDMSEGASMASCDSSSSLKLFLLPHCVSFSPTCSLDIHTVCSMIEALDLYGNFRESLHLAVGLSISILSFYEKVIREGNSVKLPVTGECTIGKKVRSTREGGAAADQGSGSQESTSREPNAAEPSIVWPVDTLLTVATFAFLFDMLSKDAESADTIVTKMSFQNARSSKSLMFQLGLLGLTVPRLPASAKYSEVRLYYCESWLTNQLMEMSLSDQDREFLSLLANAVILGGVQPRADPQSSLARVIFHHLFAGAPAVCYASFTPAQNLGLEVALEVLGYVNDQKGTSQNCSLFQYSVRRLWAKLAETVLRTLSDNKAQLDRVMACVLSQTGFLGCCKESNPTDEKKGAVFSYSSERRTPRVEVKCKVANALGRVLVDDGTQDGCRERGASQYFVVWAHHEDEEDKKAERASRPKSELALGLCAMQLGVRSLWLQKGKNYLRREVLGWLTPLTLNLASVEGMELFLQLEGGVTAFLEPSEARAFCGKLLQTDAPRGIRGYNNRVQECSVDEASWQKGAQRRRVFAQQVLSSFLEDGECSPEETRQMFSFCREQSREDEAFLVPRICQQLRAKGLTKKFPFHLLMEASLALFRCFKRPTSGGQRRRVRWDRPLGVDPFLDGDFGLKRLFEADDEEHAPPSLERVEQAVRPELSYHPEVAFHLGMQALDSLDGGEPQDSRRSWQVTSKQRSLHDFCEILIHLVLEKRKVTDFKIPIQRNDEGSADSSDDQNKPSLCPLSLFISRVVDAVWNPMWLFEILDKLCMGITAGQGGLIGPSYGDQMLDEPMQKGCASYPPLKLLAQKNLGAFSDLLLGPKVAQLIEDLNRRAGWRGQVSIRALRNAHIEGATLKDVLKSTRRLCFVSDPSGASFDRLSREMETRHPVLSPISRLMSDETELSFSDEQEEVMVARHFLPLLMGADVHSLFGFRGNPLSFFLD